MMKLKNVLVNFLFNLYLLGIIKYIKMIGLDYPPNNIIIKVIEKAEKKDPELEGIFFIDSIEKTGENFVSNVHELLESGKRSRFSMFLK